MKKIVLALILWCGVGMMGSYADETTQHTLSLLTPAFSNEGRLPVLYTCDNKDISPEINWIGVPDKTISLALILVDLNAPGGVFYHWVVYNIPPTAATFPEGIKVFPSGTLLGKNSWGSIGYKGPCPPKGSKHTYVFTLYALNSKLDLAPNADAETVTAALQEHIIDKADLTAVYSH